MSYNENEDAKRPQAGCDNALTGGASPAANAGECPCRSVAAPYCKRPDELEKEGFTVLQPLTSDKPDAQMWFRQTGYVKCPLCGQIYAIQEDCVGYPPSLATFGTAISEGEYLRRNEAWRCPDCGSENDVLFCLRCGAIKPSARTK